MARLDRAISCYAAKDGPIESGHDGKLSSKFAMRYAISRSGGFTS